MLVSAEGRGESCKYLFCAAKLCTALGTGKLSGRSYILRGSF